MKKKIGFVPMDPTLGAWLLEMLAKEPPESENAGELCAGVQDLLRGEVTSLLLSASGKEKHPPRQRVCNWGSWKFSLKAVGCSCRAGKSA